MIEIAEYQLEWSYTPKIYIEEPIEITEDYFELIIQDGKVLAKVQPLGFEKNSDFENYLDNKVRNHFCAVQINTYEDFNLSAPSKCGLKKDGSKNYFLKVESATITITAGRPDIVIKDRDGNIISDTKRDRLSKQKWFAEQIDKYRQNDIFLDYMLKCFDSAIKEKKHELFHLYDIRDALQKRFNGKKNAITILDITNSDWNILGDLANNQPLEQGRHKGQNVDILRPATQDELSKARNLALSFIEKYLGYLESENDNI